MLAQINAATAPARGLPGYTFERAPGESWRSKFDTRRNLILVNNGHRDFVYASRAKSLKLRYLVRLYAKELVLAMESFNLRGRLGAFVSAHEIPFPGNGDFGSKRRSSNPHAIWYVARPSASAAARNSRIEKRRYAGASRKLC